MQLVRVLVDPRFGWTEESMAMMRWFDLVAICTDQVLSLPLRSHATPCDICN
jgi:hypothetical protein